MQNLLWFSFGALFIYAISLLDIGLSILQSKANLYNTYIQVTIDELVGVSNEPLSYNVGFECPEEEYEYEEDNDDA